MPTEIHDCDVWLDTDISGVSMWVTACSCGWGGPLFDPDRHAEAVDAWENHWDWCSWRRPVAERALFTKPPLTTPEWLTLVRHRQDGGDYYFEDERERLLATIDSLVTAIDKQRHNEQAIRTLQMQIERLEKARA